MQQGFCSKKDNLIYSDLPAVQNEKNKIKHSKKVTKSKLEERFVVGPCGVKGEVVVVILAVMIGCRLQSLDISI